MTLGSRLFLLPMPGKTLSRFGGQVRRGSPGIRRHCENLDREADPNFDERTDILSLMLRSRYDDGLLMSHQEMSTNSWHC